MKSREEWLQAFDLEYNNVMANLAAPLDAFEISVFLSKALESIVQELYNKFEGNEMDRRTLDSLVKTETKNPLNPQITPTISNGIQFLLSSDVMYITYEKLRLTETGKCWDGKHIDIKPVSLDELLKILKNPFKAPSNTKVLRLDSGKDLVEILIPNTLLYLNSTKLYLVTYIKKPHPIILWDAPSSGSSPDSLEGYRVMKDGNNKDVATADNSTTSWILDENCCELDDALHRTIVTAAVQLASVAYKS